MTTETVADGFKLGDLEPYVGKTVHLVYRDDSGEEVEKTGEIKNLRLDIQDPMVFFNPRGRGVACIIEGTDVLGFRPSEQATRLRLVTKRKLSAPKPVTIRRHLADAHGMPLDEVNGMSDDLAMKRHAEIDHEPLGHYHAEPGESQGESAAMQGVSDELRARVAAAELGRTA